MSEITASPLCWPPGWRRSKSRTYAHFGPRGRGITIEEGVQRIRGELCRMGINPNSIIISTDLKLRRDGLPFSDQPVSKLNPGAAVYWQDGKHQRCMAIDRYTHITDNLAAIAATIEAMRAIERHGGAEILDRAFTGFAALPAPAAQDAPHEILDVSENATATEIDYAYRRLAQQCHPDVGGSHEAMTRINTARDAMLGKAP
jgi:hypothetical protein